MNEPRNCRYCGNPVSPQDETPTHSYWNAFPDVCHKACKADGIRREAYDCQLIDADCNDCRHFQRGEVVKRWLSCMEHGKGAVKLVNMDIVNGHCLKLDRPTVASPNFCSGFPCFEHRRDQPAVDREGR